MWFFSCLQGAQHWVGLSPLLRAVPDWSLDDSRGPPGPSSPSSALGEEPMWHSVGRGYSQVRNMNVYISLCTTVLALSTPLWAEADAALPWWQWAPGRWGWVLWNCAPGRIILMQRQHVPSMSLPPWIYDGAERLQRRALHQGSRQSRGWGLQHTGGRGERMLRSCSGANEEQQAQEWWCLSSGWSWGIQGVCCLIGLVVPSLG